MTQQRWESRPLECWNKAKELRQNYNRDLKAANEERRFLVLGLDGSLLAGIGNCQPMTDNPLGSLIAHSSNRFSRECMAAAECRGFGRDLCGYHREVYGSMLLNRWVWGGEFPRRDFAIATPAPCDSHTKQIQQTADHYNIPRMQGDAPCYAAGPQNDDRDKLMLEHVVAQRLEQIEWLEKLTGRKFDDKVFSETVKSSMRLKALAGETYSLNQNIPAPLDQKSLYSFFTLGGLVRSQQDETEAFWRGLRDEVKWRVENHIAAVATERYRYLEDMPPPWYFLKYYRYLEKYGAVCIGSGYTHGIGGPYEWREDGTYGRKKTPLELGWPLNTREDIVRAQILGGVAGPTGIGFSGLGRRTQRVLDMAKAFHVDGAILPLWRAGIGCVYGRRQTALELAGAGVRVMHYEGSQPGDRTDFDETRMLDEIDIWMESQGLKKLED